MIDLATDFESAGWGSKILGFPTALRLHQRAYVIQILEMTQVIFFSSFSFFSICMKSSIARMDKKVNAAASHPNSETKDYPGCLVNCFSIIARCINDLQKNESSY